MFSTPGPSRLRGPAPSANVSSSGQSWNARANTEAVSGRPAIPTKYPQVANPSKGWFPMLATNGGAQQEFAPSHHARLQIYTGLPPLLIVPKGQMLEDSFKLFPDKASGSGAIHLEFQGNTLTVRGIKETVKNIALNGTFKYDQHILDAIAQYKHDVQVGIHAPLPMLIGIPANAPQVYAPLNTNIASGSAVPSAQRLHQAAKGSMDRFSSRPQVVASRRDMRSPRPSLTIPDGASPVPDQMMADAAVAGATWSNPETIGRWEKRTLLPNAWSAAAASTRPESASVKIPLALSPVHKLMHAVQSTDSNAGTSAIHDAEISIDPAVSHLPGQAEYPLFAEAKLEDMFRSARGVLILLDREQQEELVKHLQQVRRDLSRLDHAIRTGEQPSIESCQRRLENSISLFLEMHDSHHLLGLNRPGVTVPDLSEFAQSLSFRTFVNRIIELHEALCTARNMAGRRFAPPEFGDTQYQIDMETGAVNDAADKLLHLASTQAGK